MHGNQMTRRSFALGSALAASAAVWSETTDAQTPDAKPAGGSESPLAFEGNVLAIPPEEMVTLLEREPFRAPWVELRAEFEPEILGTDEPPYDNAAGNIAIVRAGFGPDDQGRTLGIYVVMPGQDDAQSVFETVIEPPEDAEWTVVPMAIGGLEGAQRVSVSGEAILVVGNVLIIATDAFFTPAANTSAEAAIVRSAYNMTAMLDHLRSLTRPED